MSVSAGRLRRALEELTAFRAFPREPQARALIGKVLLSCCRDDLHVDALLTHLATEHDFWPGTATMKREAFALGRPPEETEYTVPPDWKREPGYREHLKVCPRCASGLVMTSDGLRRCDCPLGKKVDLEALFSDDPTPTVAELARLKRLH